MKNNFFLFRISLMILIFSSANFLSAQEKVKIKDVRKNCVKGTYRISINMTIQYLKQEPASFEAHYLLGVAYAGQANEYAEAHQNFLKEHPTPTSADEESEITILTNEMNCSDSSSLYYAKSEPMIGESFIKKNINACKVGMAGCYNEFSSGTTLESAKKMILSEVTRWEKHTSGTKKKIDEAKTESNKK